MTPRGRTERLVVVVSPADLAEIRRRAAEAGVEVPDWVRATLLGDALEPPVPRGRPRP